MFLDPLYSPQVTSLSFPPLSGGKLISPAASEQGPALYRSLDAAWQPTKKKWHSFIGNQGKKK